MTWLLDTNIFIPALNGRPACGHASTKPRRRAKWSRASSRSTANIAAVEQQLASITILPVTADVTRLFSDLKASLRRRGIVKSDVDLLIATTALNRGCERCVATTPRGPGVGEILDLYTP